MWNIFLLRRKHTHGFATRNSLCHTRRTRRPAKEYLSQPSIERLEDRTLLAAQLVTLAASVAEVPFGESVDVNIQYDVAGTTVDPPNGISIQIHYDSSKLTFESSSGLTLQLVSGFQGSSQPASLVENVSDMDSDTDRIIELIWFEAIGGWPSGGATSAELATLHFTAATDFGETNVNVTRTVDPLFDFEAINTTITVTPATFVVDTLVDETDNNGTTSLREAIASANAADEPSIIRFAESIVGTGNPITLGGTQLQITNSLTIEGPGADVLIIDAGGASRILSVDTDVTATLSGLSLQNGNDAVGGAVLNAGTLHLSEMEITDNHSSGSGGGIVNTGTLTIENSELSFNTADGAGGAIHSTGMLTVVNSTLSGNRANGDGGGLAAQGGTALARNATLTGNRANANGTGGNSGGGIHKSAAANVTLYNTIVVGNAVGTDGVETSSNVSGTLNASGSNNLIDVSAASVLNATLADNGGPTRTHTLVTTGPAVDAGSNAQAKNAADQALFGDQRGRTRFFGAAVDIGALEITPVPGFTVTESAGSTTVSESGVTDTIEVVLTAPPAGSVTINVASGDVEQLTVGVPQLIFSAGNWNVPQVAPLSAISDGVAEGTQTVGVTISVNTAKSDDAFGMLPAQTVDVTVMDGSNDDNELATLDEELGFTTESTNFFNSFGANEKWLRAANRDWYFLLPDGLLLKWDNVAGSATGTMIADVGMNVYADPSLLYDAFQPTANPALIALDEQLGFTTESTKFFNSFGANEKWLRAANRDWYFLLPDGSLLKWDNTAGMASGTMIANVGMNVYTNPSLLYDAYQPTGDADLPAIDEQLGFTGESTTFFNTYGANEKWLRAANRTWYLLLPNGELLSWDGTKGSATGSLVANVGADVYADSSLLYDAFQVDLGTDLAVIDELLGFSGEATASFNYGGQDEKWLRAANRDWYLLLPSGDVVQWDGTKSMASGTTVARLGTAVYDDPSLLYDAFQVDLGTDLAVIDQQLGFSAETTASFNYGGQNEKWLRAAGGDWYLLLTDGSLVLWGGGRNSADGTTVARLPVAVYDDPSLLYDAYQVDLGTDLAAIDAQLGFTGEAVASFNYGGQNEKWLQAADGDWYLLLPNGTMVQWDGMRKSATGTTVASLGINVYDDPALLYDASVAGPPLHEALIDSALAEFGFALDW